MTTASLNPDDARAVLELIDAFMCADSVDDYAAVTMQGMVELIPCIDASYNEMNPAAQRVEFRAYPTQTEAMAYYQPIFARLMHQNPLVRHFHQTGDTRSLMWSDFMTLDEIRETELYQDMFVHLGVDSQMAVTLPTAPDAVVGFAVNAGSEGFTERDRAVFNTLRPYLGHAYQAIQMKSEMSRLRHELRRRGWTGVLASQDGIVESVTDDAADLEAASGVTIAPGEPLPEKLREPFVRGVDAYRPTTPAVRSRSVRLSEEADGVDGWHVPGPLPPHAAYVRTGVDASRQRLEAAGLSPRQVDVALALTDGGTNPVIAKRLGIAEGTLRKHLENIYRALGVTDRASAIAAILDR